MNSEHKLNLSAAALHKVILLPIIAMVVTIYGVFGASWHLDRRTREAELSGHVVTVLNGHSTYLSREIFFDRAAAVTGRMTEIAASSEWNPNKLPARLCLHLVFDPAFNRRNAESVCSSGSAEPPSANVLAALPSIPLNVGEKHAAQLYYDLSLTPERGGFIPHNLLWPVILGMLAAALSYLVLYRRLNINLIQPAHQQIVKNEKLAAIAQFVQIIAHDIRSPFSLFRTTIRSLDDAEIKGETRTMLLAVIDKELHQVNNMLADVMTIGPIKPKADSVSPTHLMVDALRKAATLRQKPQVKFAYRLQHTKRVAVEESKLRRVLHNVVDNAMLAVNERGSIWIESRDIQNGKLVEFRIGNSGSYIAPEDRDKVFEAFFTTNKVSGTGLGLASAKTIVDAYGGKIWCESSLDQGTSFFFSLPADEARDDQLSDHAVGELPKTSEEASRLTATSQASDLVAVATPSRALKVLLADDEFIYMDSLQSSMTAHVSLHGKLQIQTSNSVAEALAVAEGMAPDLIVTDVDFGIHQPDGLTLIQEGRSRFPNAMIAAYTNRTGDDFKASVLDAGADSFITKPIGEAALATLLNGVIERIAAKDESKIQIVFVDDELIFYRSWTKGLRNTLVHYFSSPEQLWEHLANEPKFIESIDAVLTDFNFSSKSKSSGADVAKRIRSLGETPVYLVSNYSESELAERVDRDLFVGFFDKTAMPTEAQLGNALRPADG